MSAALDFSAALASVNGNFGGGGGTIIVLGGGPFGGSGGNMAAFALAKIG